MRNYRWLLAPSALALLAGLLGFTVSVLCLGSNQQVAVSAGRFGLAGSAALLAFGVLSLLITFRLTPPAERRSLPYLFLRWLIVAALMVVPTAFLFGPSGGFHHHIGFGFPFLYMVWNGEDPAPDSLQIVKGYEVWFDPIRFGIMVVVWLFIFMLAVAVAGHIPRGVDSPAFNDGAEASSATGRPRA